MSQVILAPAMKAPTPEQQGLFLLFTMAAELIGGKLLGVESLNGATGRAVTTLMQMNAPPLGAATYNPAPPLSLAEIVTQQRRPALRLPARKRNVRGRRRDPARRAASSAPERPRAGAEVLEEAFAKLGAEGKLRSEVRELVRPLLKKLPEKRVSESTKPGRPGASEFPEALVRETRRRYEVERERLVEKERREAETGGRGGWNSNKVRVPLGWFEGELRARSKEFPIISRGLIVRFRKAVYNCKL